MNNKEPKYVTFEQAKWLKEKGFKIRTEVAYHVYNPKSNPRRYVGHKTNVYARQSFISAPEQWQAVEWLSDRYERNKHLLFEEAELECLKELIEIVKNK